MDRIVSISISGFRSIERTTLTLDGLTVLIGENGTGKSTLIEALELLSKVPRGNTPFCEVLFSTHGAFRDLLRQGSPSLGFEVQVEGDGPGLTWSVEFVSQPGGLRAAVLRESLAIHGQGDQPFTELLTRRMESLRVIDQRATSISDQSIRPEEIALGWFGPTAERVHPALARMRRALERIRVHLPMEVRPGWMAEETQARAHLRQPSMVEPATRLHRLGVNLANCFQQLNNNHRDPAAVRAVLEDVRAGLGLDIESVLTPSTARGYIDLAVKFRSLPEPIYSAGLSDGQLTYLAFVVLLHLDEPGSVLVFDEPETHLHPGLLVRCAWIAQEIAKRHPVVFATHADAFLDALTDPAQQVRVCELDAARKQVLRSFDAAKLEKWREEYATLGELRRAGMAHLVLKPVVTA